jgi:hypothetical protein
MAKPNYSQNMFLLLLMIVSIITYLIILSLINQSTKKNDKPDKENDINITKIPSRDTIIVSNNVPNYHRESFCDSSRCSMCLCNGIGQEICSNRNNKIIAYNNGVTENSIPINGVSAPLYAPYL